MKRFAAFLFLASFMGACSPAGEATGTMASSAAVVDPGIPTTSAKAIL